jgi:hypothetical protein
MKKFTALFAVLLVCFSAIAQTTLSLQPDAATGKDAELFSCIPCGYSTRNFGTIAENCAIAWTKNGADHKIRSLIAFDLSSIPAGSTIMSATLSLYWAPGSDEGNHFGFFGSNKAWLQRVTSQWQENSVTWNTQPSSTTANRVSVPGSTSGTQNYPNINVKVLVQDMVNDPTHSFGFMLKLQSETVYKKLVFASSDHSNAALHPKLVVVYTTHAPQAAASSEKIQETSSTQILNVFPNPAKESVNIAINSSSEDQAFVSIYDLRGSEMTDQVYQLREGKNQYMIETARWPRGIYMVIVKTGGEMITEKLVLE